MEKILSAQKLFKNSDDECPVLGYRLLQEGCLKPYLGDDLAIDENNDVVVKVNQDISNTKFFCVEARTSN